MRLIKKPIIKEHKGKIYNVSNELVDLDLLDEEQLKEKEIKKLTSKEALKVLNEKEKELKEKLMKDIIKSKASNKEVIRTICFILNSFKRIK